MAATFTQAEQDRLHLQRALELAEHGRGRVSPNPLVGAVIVRDGEVLGEGFHAQLGGDHAEVVAIKDCRERGRDPAGATMYVTLEPCAHEGKTPPCSDAVLAAGLSRVVIASDDPSDKASGRGPGMLRDGGVEVSMAEGGEGACARLLNQPFRKHARTGKPLVTLKSAISLDGRVATEAGDSKWISGESSRRLVHAWRAETDSICVGIGTALADDPLLTARDVDRRASRPGSSSTPRLACRWILLSSPVPARRPCWSWPGLPRRPSASMRCALPGLKRSSATDSRQRVSRPRSPNWGAAASQA